MDGQEGSASRSLLRAEADYATAYEPNITGWFKAVRKTPIGESFGGAFYDSGAFSAGLRHGDADDWMNTFGFDARRTSGIFGSSGTVQARAIRETVLIKI